ncbi:MAG TPA: alpha/beta hydrolase [Burkholderiaceae bacterium]|jgi:pimeloyl-ACP methyl ester carboxylesterase|nr:alpha/beta hydrolase [Burkholderiaceae bacterium]
MTPSQSRFIDVRGLRYHLRQWGDANRTLIMLHGWMDVSASFQFVVDALGDNWRVVAPDWRGFGLTDRARADCYWYPDYLADLEWVLDDVVGSEPALVVGHSMGGNVALMYAGARPQRVRAVVNLEGFGLQPTHPEQAPGRFAQWIDQLKQGAALRDYASREEVAARLMKNNSRLSVERATFLAQHWSESDKAGRFRVAGDPAHRIINPTLYRIDEVLACWRSVACPVLWVRAAQTDVLRHVGTDRDAALREIETRKSALRDVESVVVENAGHMLHHDQPDEVARLIDDFMRRKGGINKP